MKAPDDVLVRALTNRALELTVMPTEACNFRCTYCYEDFALGRMPAEVVRGVKNLISARAPGLDSLSLAWFGGEPLLALDVIRDVQAHVQVVASAHPGLRAHANMTTNAWKLVPEVFDELVGLGVNEYQISFDGPQEMHDRKRKRLDGKGTFARIWRNVLAMRDSTRQFQVILRVHVDHENLESIFGFVDRIRAELGHDPRFSIFLKQIGRYGGANDANLPVLSTEEDSRLYQQLLAHTYGTVEQEHVRGAGGKGSPKLCYAAKGNSHVVRSDGRLCKCTVALDNPANVVGRIHEDGTVEIDAARSRPWMRGLWSGVTAELLCPMIGIEEAVADG